MAAKFAVTLVSLLFLSRAIDAQSLPTFMGRQLTIAEPERNADGTFPNGPASVCIAGPPHRQCYTAPGNFGNAPKATIISIRKETPAIFFSTASGGTSGWRVHFALLRPNGNKDLEDLFMSDMEVSNQSQHAFWTDQTISSSPIFVTADFVWGPDEAHYDNHRYIVSAYVYRHQALLDNDSYFLGDRYMTANKYNSDAGNDVLASEKQEAFARLKRLGSRGRRSP
jgi:hypothetical protein